MTKTTYPTETELETMRLPELQALFGKLLRKPTRSPNRKFLLRSIKGALASQRPTPKGRRRGEAQGNAMPPATPPAAVSPAEPALRTPSGVDAGAPAAGAAPRGHYMGMSVPALQGIYLEKIGRPTNSHDRAYLVWKIREAEKGRVPIGPRKRRDPADEMKTIPIRIGKKGLAGLDAVWRATGYRSRAQFIDCALGGLLKQVGALEAAQHFGQSQASR